MRSQRDEGGVVLLLTSPARLRGCVQPAVGRSGTTTPKNPGAAAT